MSRQWNYGCMFPGSLCCTWIETDGSKTCLLWCALTLLITITQWIAVVLPPLAFALGQQFYAGQAPSVTLLINTQFCVIDAE